MAALLWSVCRRFGRRVWHEWASIGGLWSDAPLVCQRVSSDFARIFFSGKRPGDGRVLAKRIMDAGGDALLPDLAAGHDPGNPARENGESSTSRREFFEVRLLGTACGGSDTTYAGGRCAGLAVKLSFNFAGPGSRRTRGQHPRVESLRSESRGPARYRPGSRLRGLLRSPRQNSSRAPGLFPDSDRAHGRSDRRCAAGGSEVCPHPIFDDEAHSGPPGFCANANPPSGGGVFQRVREQIRDYALYLGAVRFTQHIPMHGLGEGHLACLRRNLELIYHVTHQLPQIQHALFDRDCPVSD